MAEYYVSSSNLTFSLHSGSIVINDGSGSFFPKQEISQQWFLNQTELTIADIIKITEQVSGSNTYVKDKGWY